jgi:electron-transferring-flavoprotein dehydrogenase
VTGGKLPPGSGPELHRDAEVDVSVPDKPLKDRYPQPDGKYFFDKLSSVFITGNATRDDAPSHIRVQPEVAPEVAEMWVNLCPAKVYEAAVSGAGDEVRGPGAEGRAHVEVTASNCVQCGAISAKGGRLTPPEGGSGPEYSLT